MKTKIARINEELAREIDRVAKKNQMKFVEASKEIAQIIKKNRNKKIKREIIF